jgi:hypothetical protein
MICPERVRLAHEYSVSVDSFRDSVLALKDLRSVEFDRAYEVTVVRRAALEKARMALEHHRREHRC